MGISDGGPDYAGYSGFFKTGSEIDRFVAGLGPAARALAAP